jgi:SAM-dependent methyltransferase
MTSSPHVPSASYSYVGQELDLFAKAANWKAYFGSRLAPFIRGDVLEVGAGIGQTTRHLCDGRQRSWTCLEPDPLLADRLARDSDVRALAPRPTVRVGTTASLGAGERFDAILYVDVLEHIEHDRAELARAADLLAPKGALIVLSPAFQFLFSDFDRSVGHYRRYTAESLADVMPVTVKRRDLYYLDSVGFLASLANRALLRQSMPTGAQIGLWDGRMVPISRVVDPLFRRVFGRSVIGIYERC